MPDSRRLASLLGAGPAILVRFEPFGPASGRFVSENAEAILGLPAADLVADPDLFVARIHPADIARLAATLAAVFAGEPAPSFEHRWRRPDGAWRWLHVDLRLVRRDGQPLEVVGCCLDVTEHKRAESDLLALTHAADASPSMVLIADPGLRIEFVNARYTAVTGYAREDVSGQDACSLCELPPDERAAMRETLLSGGGWRRETRRRRKDGTLYRARSTIWPVRGAGGRIVRYLEIADDVTAERRGSQLHAAEHAVTLALAEAAGVADGAARVREAVGRALGFQAICYWKRDPTDGRLQLHGLWRVEGERLDAFARACRASSFAPAEGAIGRAWATRSPVWLPDLSEADDPRAAAAAAAGLRGAVAFPSRLGGQPIGIVELCADEPLAPDDALIAALDRINAQIVQFIKRIDAEQALVQSLEQLEERVRERTTALRASERRVRMLQEQMPAVLWTTDADLRITSMTGRALPPLGVEQSSALGRRLERWLVPEGHAAVAASRRALGGEHAAVRLPFREHWFEGRVEPLRDVRGRAVGTIGVALDVTGRERVERMKEHFVSAVSHELRTPLTSIQAALALLRSNAALAGTLTPRARELLDIAFRNGERLGQLTSSIVDLERMGSGKLDVRVEPVDLAALLAQAAESNRPFGDLHGVSFRVAPPPAPAPRALADPGRLMQVLTNLLSNAAKFSPRGGEVVLAVERRGGQARLTVADRGAGIPEHFRPRVFERFAQADASDSRRGGSGLGLCIAKAIVERMGGAISFASEVGVGTVFHVDLPELHAHADDTASAPHAAAP